MNCIIILVFLVLSLIPGFLSELLIYLFFLAGFLRSKKYLRNKCLFLAVLIIYAFLFLLHYMFGNHSSSELIRLLGLTKCICTPVLVYMCFFCNAIKMSSYITICAFMFVLNILYASSDITVIGSENICAGLDLVLLPMSFLLLTRQTSNLLMRLFCFSFIMICCYFILKTTSTTSHLILILQVCFFIVRTPVVRLLVRGHMRDWMMFLVVMIMLFSLIVGLEYISLEPSDLSERVIIWRRALVQFALSDDFGVVFGGGDHMAPMMTDILPAHNFMLEILLIYGLVGFMVTFIIIIIIIHTVFHNKNEDEDLLALTIIAYFLVCVMHPAFTGIFFFQWGASIVMLIMYNFINRKY